MAGCYQWQVRCRERRACCALMCADGMAAAAAFIVHYLNDTGVKRGFAAGRVRANGDGSELLV